MNINLKSAFTATLIILIPYVNFGQAPNLGTASSFALITAAGAFDNLGATMVTGDIGTNVGAFTGFPPGIVVGQIHVADPASAQAAADVNVAYNSMSGITCGAVIGTTLGNNQQLTPNVYCLGAASTLNGDLILDGQGNPNALFIFKIDGALSTSTFSNVILTNSASLCNVYWQINGAFSLGDSSVFRGTVIANGAISLLAGSSLLGRGLSRQGAIELNSNLVTIGFQAIASTISAGGATTFCTGDSVILSGNSGGIWSSGAVTPSITVKTSGNYFVTDSTSCGSITSNHIIVTVNTIPSCNITGNTIICQGLSTQLCAPAATGNSYLWSMGATSRCITVSSTGTITVTVTKNGCSSTCSTTIASAPSCAINGSSTVCQGTSVSLCAPSGTGYTYLWSTSSTSRCITVSNPGTFSVTVTKNGCSSICSKTVTSTAAPSCTITGNSTICQGTSTSLCAPTATGNTYLWSTGSTASCITVNNAGTFSVTVTRNGLASTCSKTVVINPKPLCNISGNLHPAQGQSTLLCAPSGMTTYQWSTGATTSCINVFWPRTYTTTITNSNGCTSSCNVCVSHSSREGLVEGDLAGNDFEIKAYPNPFNDKTTIEFQNNASDSHILMELFNLAGNKIVTLFNKNIEKGLLYNVELYAANIPAGIYICRIANGTQIINRKIIVIK